MASGSCESCAEEQEDKLRRKAVTPASGNEVAPIVNEVLNSSGWPLDTESRSFMESRFRHDFSGVRVHTDSRAAESCRSVDALAYTVEQNIVFGANQYRPATADGRRLLAHELAHVMQHRTGANTSMARLRVDSPSSPAEVEADKLADMALNGSSVPAPVISANGIQRACLSAAECGTAAASQQGSQQAFVAETEAKPENKSRADKRKEVCGKAPPDPACTADGHSAEAANLTTLLKERLPERVGFIAGVFIDKDIPAQYGAVTRLCSDSVPPKPFPGKRCTWVPEGLEKEAAQFNADKSTKVGGRDRQDWLTMTLRSLTHETEHGRFRTAPAIAKPSPSACDFDAISSNLSEMSAIISEFRIVFRRLRAKPEAKRQPELDSWFKFWIETGGENISGNVKGMRCACECNDADEYIRRAIGAVTTSWNTYELHTFHSELRRPKWNLKWPIAPPPAIKVEDLPSEGIEIDVRDLPKK